MSRCPTCGQEIPYAEAPYLAETGVVTRYGHSVQLAYLERRLFRALLDAHPHMVPTERLYAVGWPSGNYSSNVLTVHIHKMRSLLALLEIGIRNEHGRGYRLVFFG